MTHTVEQEIKLIAEEADYQQLRMQISRSCNHASYYEQENHFFDSSEGLLSQVLMSIRLRKQNHSLLLTCKHRLPQRDLIHSQDEYEYPVNHALWHAACVVGVPLNRIMHLPQLALQRLAGADLQPSACFTNKRWEFRDGPHHLCLDHSTFNNTIDEYELEIESPEIDQAAEKWLPLLEQWGLKLHGQSRSKLERCLAYAKNAAV